MSSFNFDGTLTKFLFEQWNALTPGDVFLACLAIGLAALLLELTKTVRINLRLLYPVNRRANRDAVPQSSERTPLLGPSLVVSSAASREHKRRIKVHVSDSVLYLLQVIVGYFVMLAVMSFNGWIFISVVAASALGYLLFGLFRYGWLQTGVRSQALASMSDDDANSRQSRVSSAPPAAPASMPVYC